MLMLLGCLLSFAPTVRAGPITLGLIPVSQTVAPGDTANLEVSIGGLGDSSAPSLSAYDLDVLFDFSVLTFSGVTFGDTVLGNQLDLTGFGTLSAYDASTPGVLNLFEISFDDPSTLDSLQAGAFTLATISFSATGSGISPISLSINSLGDSIGNPLTVNEADILGATVTVRGESQVPEPATFIPVGFGLLLLGIQRHLVRRRLR